MNETTLLGLWGRKLAGERVKALAVEAGMTTQGLVAAWKKAGLTGEAEVPAADAPMAEGPGATPEAFVKTAMDDANSRTAPEVPAEALVVAGPVEVVEAVDVGVAPVTVEGPAPKAKATKKGRPAKLRKEIGEERFAQVLTRFKGGEKLLTLSAELGLVGGEASVLWWAMRFATQA